MTLTLDTTATPYMSELQYCARADCRTVADLVSDNGLRVGGPGTTPQDLVGNVNLLAALIDASGDLEAVCLIGGRYHQTDLAQIAAATGTGAQGKMFRVLARMTTLLLWERRLDRAVPQDLARQVAEDKQRLAAGDDIFGSLTHEAAGLPAVRVENGADVRRRHLADTRAHRFFGRRDDTYPVY